MKVGVGAMLLYMSRRTPKIASKPPEARGEAENRFFPSVLKGNQACWPLDLGLLASRSMRISLAAVAARFECSVEVVKQINTGGQWLPYGTVQHCLI